MFSYLKISDYCNFDNFEIYFDKEKSKENELNLNILIGRNGSGKSSFLDALFQIGENNLKSKNKEIDNTTFGYEFKLNNSKKEYHNTNKPEEALWDLVIRLHTGHTKRQTQPEKGRNILSLSVEDAKWALLVLFLSGKWSTENLHIAKIQSLMLGNNPEDNNADEIEPKIVWLETNIDIEDKENDKKLFIEDIAKPDFKRFIQGKYRYFWNIKNIDKTNPNLFRLFKDILSKKDAKEDEKH